MLLIFTQDNILRTSVVTYYGFDKKNHLIVNFINVPKVSINTMELVIFL